jgi:hypothetical protein
MRKERKHSKQVIVTAFLLILLLILSFEHISMPLMSNKALKETILGSGSVTIPIQINKHRIPDREITKVGNILSCNSYNGGGGLEILDVSNVNNPTRLGNIDDGGAALGVVVGGSYAYVADYNDGLDILKIKMRSDSITVTNPASNSKWTKGNEYSIIWNYNGSFSHVKIELYKSSSLALTLTSSTSNDGSYNWTVDTSLTADTTYRIKVTSTSDSDVYAYSAYFEISTTPTTIPGFEFVYLMLGLIACVVPLVLYQRRVFSSPRRHPRS